MYRSGICMLISFSIVVALAIARGSAQTTTAAPAPTSSAVPPAAQPANGPALEARLARLSSTLAVIDERIQTINDRSEISTRILYGFSLFGGFILILFSIRDWLSRCTETNQQGEGLKKVNDVIDG